MELEIYDINKKETSEVQSEVAATNCRLSSLFWIVKTIEISEVKF